MKIRSAFCLFSCVLIFSGCFQPVDLGETIVEKGTAHLRITNASADDAYVLEGLELRNAAGEVEQSWAWPGLEALEAGTTKEVHTESTGSFTLLYRVKDKDISGSAVYEGGSVDIKPNSIHEVLFKGEAAVTQQDEDGDGLPDAWERENGFDPTDSSDGGVVYVKANGQDEAPANGTRDKPYKTLAKAAAKAGRGLTPEARTVVVLGKLTLATGGNDPGNREYPGRLDSAFYLGKTRRPVTIGGENSDSIAALTVESTDNRNRRVLYLDSGADVTLRNIEISGGKHDGGGVYAYGANLTLGPGTTVKQNQSLAYTNPDAKDCGGILMERGILTMKEGSSVIDNTGGIGGGVKLIGSRLTMENNSKINNNKVKYGAAGLRVENSVVEMLAGSEISGNIAGDSTVNTGAGGGGVTVEAFSTFTMYMGSKISGNIMHNGFGGGLYISGQSTMTMKGGLISGNQCIMGTNFSSKADYLGASGRGGGIALTNGSFFIMEGGTIAKNTAARSGGGLYFTEGGTTFVMRGGTIYGKGDTGYENVYLSTDTSDGARGGHAIINYNLGGGSNGVPIIKKAYETDVTAANYP
jgi:hypothetical protein